MQFNRHKIQVNYTKLVAELLTAKKTKISCVIPAYNEAERIADVLQVVANYPYFNEVVIIDDGSTDKTIDAIKTALTKFSVNKFHVLQNGKNIGKTQTIKKAIDFASGDLIVLLDADLKGLQQQNISKMIYFVLKGEFDMTILDRGGDRMSPIGLLQSWTARFNGGERSFWKSEFTKISFPQDSYYALEQIMNLHYIKAQLKVRTIYTPNLTCSFQFEKKGWMKGFATYTKMFIESYKNSKIKGYYFQVRDVVEDRIEPLYKFYENTKYKKAAVTAIILSGLIMSIGSFIYLNSRRVIKHVRIPKNIGNHTRTK